MRTKTETVLHAAPGQTMTYALVDISTNEVKEFLLLEDEPFPAAVAKQHFAAKRGPSDKIFLMLGGE
jgi:hypothetical protein